MRDLKIILGILFLSIMISSSFGRAEAVTREPSSEDSYESEISKGDQTKQLDQELNSRAETAEEVRINKISELDKLVPFQDIAVIQKRYLPKTGRFELYPNIGMVTNNPFFFSGMFQVRGAYALTEKWAIEGIASLFTNTKYKVTKDLKDHYNVDTESHILTKGYYGLDLRWSPVYGKMGMFNNGILPFDLYFSFGGGKMQTNQSTSPFVIHTGMGQIFAIKKWMAFRWDLSGYFYSSETKATATGASAKESFQDIHLGLGLSFFFPEAKYR